MRYSRSTLTTIVAAFIVFGISGCIDYREQISFNADGSGTIVGRLFIPNETLRFLVRDTDSTLYRATVDRLDHDEIADRIRCEGVTIRRAERIHVDSGIVVAIEYEFSDLEAFRRTRGNGRDIALNDIDGLYEITLMFSGDAHGFSPTTPMEETAGETEPEIAISAPSIAALDSLLTGYHVAFEIRVPTQVVSAPGGRFREDTAQFVWSFAHEGRTVLEPKTIRVIFRKGELMWPTFEAIPYGSVESGSFDDASFDDAWNNGY